MRIGVNWIAPQSFTIIEKLVADGLVDFCEIMLDNFIHLNPQHFDKCFSNLPCAFHLVATRFLEKDPASLTHLAERIRLWADRLNPLYISDHLMRFTDDFGTTLPIVTEPDYLTDPVALYDRVNLWQSLLGTTLLIENHASMTKRGQQQAAFFKNLMAQTQCGLLYDFSNAYIAEQNNIANKNLWYPLISACKHFHVGGFKAMPGSSLLIDSHDVAIDENVKNNMRLVSRAAAVIHALDRTCVIEFDVDVGYDTWKKEIIEIKNLLCH